MKKLIGIIGILILMGISFFYTKKLVSFVNNYDDIMIKIKNTNKYYYKKAINATIINNTIIPGISGVEVDINKSYSKMKRYGRYNSSLLVFKKIKPSINLKNNKDKYIIGGNKKRRSISIIFIIKKNNNIDKLMKIVTKKNIKVSFFATSSWLEDNVEYLNLLIKDDYNLGIIDKYKWSSNIIKKISKQKEEYCFTNKLDNNIFNHCKNKYVIKSDIISSNYYNNTINYLENGKIIVYTLNNQVLIELPIIINYIKSKDYNIVNLKTLLEE